MKYTTELTINLPRKRVIELFDNSENLKKWQMGLVRFEPMEGSPGKAGAKTRLVYQMGKREVVMEEEIIENALPDSIHFVFRSDGVENDNKSYFSSATKETTLWRQENEFNMKGFWGFIATIAPGMFKKQTLRDMNRFKDFAEGEK